jgi:hypothetical protein
MLRGIGVAGGLHHDLLNALRRLPCSARGEAIPERRQMRRGQGRNLRLGGVSILDDPVPDWMYQT